MMRLSKLEKSSDITEDERRRGQDQVQEITDKKITEIDEILERKEKEMMEV
jgi:ribosome recycling factor